MRIKALIGAVTALVAGLLLGPVPSAGSTGPPNVVVILVDDARTGDVSTMPNIQRLVADQGVTFDKTFAPFPLCCPARATILTGKYAHNHKVLGNSAPLGGWSAFDDDSTLATWLTGTYRTAWIGKYMNQYSEKRAWYVPPGWDEWRAALGQSYANYRGNRFSVNGNVVDTTPQYSADVDTQWTKDFIASSAASGEPFFVLTSYFAPHGGTPVEPDDPNVVYNTTAYPTPNVADKHHNALVGLPVDRSPSFNEADVSDKPAYIRKKRLFPQWKIDALTENNQQRRESLLSVDDGVVEIIDQLRTSGVLDNTYVIFLSDNGFVLGEHRLSTGKSDPYEPSVRVPMSIRGPGIPAGSHVNQLVGQQDLAPTILAMTGQSTTASMDGMNLLPMIGNPAVGATRPMVLEIGPRTSTATQYQWYGIRTQEWKYIVNDTGEKELYDMVNDPDELNNVHGQSAYATAQARMEQLLAQYERCSGTGCW